MSYDKSKNLDTIPGLKKFPIELKNDLIESVSVLDRQVKGQLIINVICDQLKIPRIRLNVSDAPQKHSMYVTGRLKRKTLGQYTHRGNSGIGIQIWNLTAKQHKVVSGKTFFHTLLHEVCHHIDCAYFGFIDSPHTSGFYRRISYLESMFK